MKLAQQCSVAKLTLFCANVKVAPPLTLDYFIELFFMFYFAALLLK